MPFQKTPRLLLAPLARLAFRPVVEGRENVPPQGPVILAANHLSFIDSVVIPLLAPRPVTFLAKAEYFQQPGLKGWLTRTCFTGLGAVRCPSRDGRIYRGRTGVAWLAFASGAPVVPVAVLGTDRVQPVGAPLPRPGRITVRFGAPLRFTPPADGRHGRARRVATDEIMGAIRQLSGQEPADRYNELPAAA